MVPLELMVPSDLRDLREMLDLVDLRDPLENRE